MQALEKMKGIRLDTEGDLEFLDLLACGHSLTIIDISPVGDPMDEQMFAFTKKVVYAQRFAALNSLQRSWKNRPAHPLRVGQ